MDSISDASTGTYFQSCSSVNISCGVIGRQIIGLLVFEECLTSKCYPHLLQASTAKRCSSLYQVRAMTAARWCTPSFWQADNCISQSTFSKSLTGQQGSGAWPPKSSDQTPLDYYLWECMECLVYALKHLD
jgi:hypothetical protein